MAILLKLLPLVLLAAFLYVQLTAHRRVAEAIRRRSAPLEDRRLLAGVEALERALGLRGVRLRVLDEAMINAVVLAEGREVYLTRGLYDAYRAHRIERHELVAIVAHELGHVALGHMQRRVAQLRVQSVGAVAAGFLIGRLAVGWILLPLLLALSLWRLKMSRDDEFEADAFAAGLLARAGLDPRSAVEALRAVERLQRGANGQPPMRPPAWLASHPPTEERVAALEALITRSGY